MRLRSLIPVAASSLAATVAFYMAWMGSTPTLVFSQSVPIVITSNGAPSNGCGSNWLDIDYTTGNLYTCKASVWQLSATASGGLVTFQTFSINVKASPYSCKGDGVTDDSTCIQNALTACFNGTVFATPRGCKIHFPMGTYLVGTALTYTDNNGPLELEGEGWGSFNENADGSHMFRGTAIVWTANGGTLLTIGHPTVLGESGPFIHDMNFIDNGNNTATLVQIQNLNHWTVERVSFRHAAGATGNGIALNVRKPNAQDVSWGRIDQIIVRACNTCGLTAVNQPDGDGGYLITGSDLECGTTVYCAIITGPQVRIIGIKMDTTFGVDMSGHDDQVIGSQFEKDQVGIYIHDTNLTAWNGSQNAIVGNHFRGSDTLCDAHIRVGPRVGTGVLENSLVANVFENGAKQCVNVDSSSLSVSTLRMDGYGFSVPSLGSIKMTTVPRPSTPVVTTIGVTGAATWSYVVTALDAAGTSSIRSFTGSTATGNGNATLSGGNCQVLTWAPDPGAAQWNVYRTVSGGVPATIGKITPTPITNHVNFQDCGAAGDASTAPAADQGTGAAVGALQVDTAKHINQTAASTVAGTAVLNGASPAVITVNFSLAYINAPVCFATNQTTQANPVKVTPSTGSVVITGPNAATDTVAWLCIGNPN